MLITILVVALSTAVGCGTIKASNVVVNNPTGTSSHTTGAMDTIMNCLN